MNKENLHTIFSNSECLSEERILAYCTNKLTNLERNEVERHTINCKFCSDALEGFEKKIHTAKGYDSAKAAIHKKEKKNKSFIITITGIAAACLAFVLLINEFDQNQAEVADHKNEAEKTQKEKSKSYKLEPKLGNRNDSNHREDLNDTGIHVELNGANAWTNDSTQTIALNPEGLNSSFKSNLKEKDNENAVFEEDILEEEDVSYNLNYEGDHTTYSWDTEINEVNKPQNQTSKSRSIQFKKENEVDKLPDAQVRTSDKYFEDGLAKHDGQLSKDTSKYQNNLNYLDIIDQSSNNVAEINELSMDERKGIISLNDSNDRRKSSTDSISFSGTSLYSLGENKEFDLGLLKFKNEAYNEAIKIFEEIKQDNTHYFEAQLYIGKCYIKLNNDKKAKPYLKNALTGDKTVKSEAEKLLKRLK